MALITANEKIAEGVFRLTLAGVPRGHAGQFFEVHLSDGALLLPRPISLYDADEGTASLVYRIVGRGTKLLSSLKEGELRVTGPLGNGYMLEEGAAVLIGGGLGVAPLHLLARELRESDPARDITVCLGYSGSTFLTDEYEAYATRLVTDVGGYITDKVDFSLGATYYACGPEPMMRAAAKKAREAGAKLYVSLERRMACGVGACFACSVATAHGNRRVCKDGPVFPANEVYFNE